MPKVSIILPFKNSSGTISECITSILRQNLNHWELIAIDDHSTDSSFSMVESFCKVDKRITILKNPGDGIVDSLNFGIKKANTLLIARMDADDIMHPKRLLLQVERLEEKRELGLISCLVNHVAIGDHDTRGYQKYVHWINKICSTREISLNRFIESPFAHPSVVFRRELVSEYGGYRKGDFPEDYELWLRFLNEGVQMEKVNNYLLDWRDSKQRTSRTGSNYKLDAFQNLKSIYLKKWIEKNVPSNKSIQVWGAGKFAKQQIKYLKRIGISIEYIYDIDSNKIVNRVNVLHINQIPNPDQNFILCLIGKDGARGKIAEFLSKKGYIIEKDFIFAA